MNPRDTNPQTGKNVMDDIDRMTNEGLAGGREGDLTRNALVNTPEMPEETPPTLNGEVQ
ncbi:hypothetical protein [Ammoniphilus sp. YIM 78166]|uniref:hypothetical protein n=1 Tax=Ammoniphilus sp. YIM 78166 TaxID=1644106 RepID=UPI001430AD82|nr:hypothetical protein [Ammoniphilus sp. YIM 78166]